MYKEIIVMIVLMLSITVGILIWHAYFLNNIEAECTKLNKIVVRTTSGYACVDGFRIN